MRACGVISACPQSLSPCLTMHYPIMSIYGTCMVATAPLRGGAVLWHVETAAVDAFVLEQLQLARDASAESG